MSKTQETLPLLSSAVHTKRSLTQYVQHLTDAIIPPRLLGVVLVAASAVTFSLLSTLIKYASYSMPSMETVFWRSGVAWLLNLIAARVYNIDLRVERRFWSALATRCLAGSFSMCLAFYAMQQLVLADASVLLFTNPIMTFFLGALVLNERIDSINLGFALFSFVGVICVSRPTFIFGTAANGDDTKDGSVFGVCCALLGAVVTAVSYVSVRRLQQLNFIVVINYYMLMATVLSGFSLVVVQHEFVIDMSISVWLAVLGTGFLGFVGQLLLTRGFQLESAGIAAVMRSLDVVFVFIWDLTLLKEHINAWSVVGAAIVCGSAAMIAIRRMKQ